MGFCSKTRVGLFCIASILVVTATLGSTIGCQTAQKSSFLPPSQAQAPALVASSSNSPDPHQTKTNPAEPQSKPQVPQALKVDPVADLIARVEKEYQAGQDNYQAGHLEAAKLNFDSAFNQLLGNGFDLKSDDRLEQELDRILDGINGLEAAALQQGDGFAEQKSEPAPIDEANELTPTVDQNVKAKAEAELKSTHSDLPLVMTDQVAGYINYFSNRGRGTLEHALARSGRYEDMIHRVLREQGVPQELIYLAQAESGFHPLAVSRAGARGMWQFMASRAKGYGLERDWWVDERQDPEKSTRAAAHHLKDLYNEFGDWYLAMAAYNSGPGTVQSAVKRTGFADFWELYRRNVLPKETRNYVPIILAVTIMAKNPSQYGLNAVAMEHPADYDTVTLTAPVDLRLVAECVGGNVEDLQDLNPSLRRLTTPHEGKFELHLPAGTKDQYETAMAAIPAGMRLWWRYHTVQSGDTLASLARTYHTTAKSIADANNLDTPAGLEADAKLVIPVAPGKHPLSDTATYARRITRYKVHSGDTVETVADNFGVSPLMIRRWNGLRGESLSGRKVLALHLPITPSAHATEVASARMVKKHSAKPAAQTASAKPPVTKSAKIERIETASVPVVHHKVRTGETLYSIATYYKTTVAAIKRDNRDVAILRPGMILIVP